MEEYPRLLHKGNWPPKNVKSGSGGGSRKSEYIFFKQLQFLKNVVAVKEPEHEHVADEEPTENSEPDTQMVQRKKKRTKATTCTEDDKFLETLQRSIETREKIDEKNDDEDRLFMLSLVGTLKKVPPERKMDTTMKIMSILDNATKPVYYPQSSWSQSQQMHQSPSSYHPGYSTRSGGSEMSHTSPLSNLTNYSDESTILDMYD